MPISKIVESKSNDTLTSSKTTSISLSISFLFFAVRILTTFLKKRFAYANVFALTSAFLVGRL